MTTMDTMPFEFNDDEIYYRKRVETRIASGKKHCYDFHSKSDRNKDRYLSNTIGISNKDVQTVIEGDVNYIAANIRVKVANMTTGKPDFEVDAEIPEASDLVREFIKTWWHKRKWETVIREVATSLFVTGLGIVSYVWDEENGFVLEPVAVQDYIFDPNTPSHNLENPRWCAKRVYIPKDVALQRYGDAIRQCVGYDERTPDETPIGIWVYYDDENEIELYDGLENKFLKVEKNLYGRPPIRLIQGGVNPKGGFPLSDYDICMGASSMLAKQHKLVNDIAMKSGGREFVRIDFVDESVRKSLLDNTHTGLIPIKGVPGDDVVGVTTPQQITETTLLVMETLRKSIDAEMGVGESDRGVIQSKPEFASQVALLASRSGVRTTLLRQELERFIEDIVSDFVSLSVNFGLDPRSAGDEDVLIWNALSSVQAVRVVEESLMTANRAIQQQEAMQIFNLAMSAFPLMNQMGYAPDLKKFMNDILRYGDRSRDIESYYLQTGGLIGAGELGTTSTGNEHGDSGESKRKPA